MEIGDHDGVVMLPRRFVDVELSRVEEMYGRLGIPGRGRIARFNSGHRVDTTESFSFLDRWLAWKPKPD